MSEVWYIRILGVVFQSSPVIQSSTQPRVYVPVSEVIAYRY